MVPVLWSRGERMLLRFRKMCPPFFGSPLMFRMMLMMDFIK